MSVCLNVTGTYGYLDREELKKRRQEAGEIYKDLLAKEDREQVLGWRSLDTSAVQLELMKEKAEEICRDADIFVIVGVGGSNQAARAMIETLQDREGPEIVYLGNTLSSYSISHTLKRMEGKSVYIDMIAKNFETLEPGSHFRILRQWMRERYQEEELARRIVVTGTLGSRLEEIASENGYLFLQFPVPVGGRYSAFTPVGLFPAAVAGLDIDAFLAGVQAAMDDCRERPADNPGTGYGELFYYFMMGCAVSGTLMGVNPFDQEGVEEYKRSMFAALGRA